jgi:hypothetical protein
LAFTAFRAKEADRDGMWGHGMSARREDWFFDLLVELCDHAEAKGMSEVSQRLEEALDALVAWEGGQDVVPFRTIRQGDPATFPRPVPRERRITFAG